MKAKRLNETRKGNSVEMNEEKHRKKDSEEKKKQRYKEMKEEK